MHSFHPTTLNCLTGDHYQHNFPIYRPPGDAGCPGSRPAAGQKPAEKSDVLQAIRRMGVLQIDTIHVIARSPYLVLWSRLGDYRPEWLDELLAEGALFEYWSHAMCFLPIEDYPLYRRRMLDRRTQSPRSGALGCALYPRQSRADPQGAQPPAGEWCGALDRI